MNARDLADLLAEIDRARDFLLRPDRGAYAEALKCWSQLGDLVVPVRIALKRIEVPIEEPQA